MSSLHEECRGFLISCGIVKIYICFQNPVMQSIKNPENNKKSQYWGIRSGHKSPPASSKEEKVIKNSVAFPEPVNWEKEKM
jgi:hypothetical protein